MSWLRSSRKVGHQVVNGNGIWLESAQVVKGDGVLVFPLDPFVSVSIVDGANAGADAVACAAVLHYKKETVAELKEDIRAGGVEVRRV